MLTPSLQELAKPSVRALPAPSRRELLGIAASGPGSLLREGGRVVVEARFEPGAIAELPAVEAAGGGGPRSAAAATRRRRSACPTGDLRELGAVPGLSAVPPSPGAGGAGTGMQGGTVISEGVAQLNVEAARANLGRRRTKAKG